MSPYKIPRSHAIWHFFLQEQRNFFQILRQSKFPHTRIEIMLTRREMHFHSKLHPLDSSPLESRDFFPRQRKFPVNIRRRFNSFRHGGRVRMFEWPQLMPVNQKRHVVAAINKSVPPLVCIFTGDYFKAPRAQIHATDEEVVDALAEWRMQLIPGPWLRHGWLIFRNNSVVGDLQFELWTQRNRLFISNIT